MRGSLFFMRRWRGWGDGRGGVSTRRGEEEVVLGTPHFRVGLLRERPYGTNKRVGIRMAWFFAGFESAVLNAITTVRQIESTSLRDESMKKYFAISLSFPIFAFYIVRIKDGEE